MDQDDVDIPDESNARLADDLRSESKTQDRSNASAQSKLVQDIMSRQAEQEAAARSGRADSVEDGKAVDGGSAPQGGGIRLTRMRKSGK